MVEPAAGGKTEKLAAEIVLMAIGRKPYTEGLGLENAGVRLDERKRVEVDEFFESSVEGIYAIGDVIKGPMLAHKAEDEGVILAEMLAGQSGHIDYDKIPGVVYTHPEVASVGKTEEQLKKDGVEYRAGKIPVHGQWPRAGDGHDRRFREDSGGCENRPRTRCAYHRAGSGHVDR
jgi:dihydrolipoamide dehydrogenase